MNLADKTFGESSRTKSRNEPDEKYWPENASIPPQQIQKSSRFNSKYLTV